MATWQGITFSAWARARNAAARGGTGGTQPDRMSTAPENVTETIQAGDA
jgi:hypothetical protein